MAASSELRLAGLAWYSCRAGPYTISSPAPFKRPEVPAITGSASSGQFRVVPPHRLPQKLRGATDIELLLDARAVGLHRLDADREVFRDLAGADALPEFLEDLELAIAQPLDHRLARCPAARRLG